jgi:CTD kinase subunit gamma
MDPFEARLQFIKSLQRLNASAEANENAAKFLVKVSDLSEDLYSCVLEELDKSAFNVRLNIFYFLETVLCDCNVPQIRDFQQWIARDMDIIYDKVVPATRLGLVNFSASGMVLSVINDKIDEPTRLRLKELIHKREELLERERSSAPESIPTVREPDVSLIDASLTGDDNNNNNNTLGRSQITDSRGRTNGGDISREEVLRRMDEDRERSKRLKESLWAIDYKTNELAEFDKMWSTIGPLMELDFEQMREDNEIAQGSINMNVNERH